MSNPSRKRSGSVQWVALADLRINERAQREFNEPWARSILAGFDPDKMQYPTVNHRDGHHYVVDGQHSVWAYKMWLQFWDDQKIECIVHEGLTEEQEAELFLSLNNKRVVGGLEKFKAAVTAGRADETNIDAVVRAQGCKISRNRSQSGAIRAVGSLSKIYRDYGPVVLGETVGLIRDCYGDAGYEAAILVGIAGVLDRYPSVHLPRLQIALHDAAGGSKGLLNSARALQAQVGGTMSNACSAAVVNIYNRTKGPKLPSWWKSQEAA